MKKCTYLLPPKNSFPEFNFLFDFILNFKKAKACVNNNDRIPIAFVLLYGIVCR